MGDVDDNQTVTRNVSEGKIRIGENVFLVNVCVIADVTLPNWYCVCINLFWGRSFIQ